MRIFLLVFVLLASAMTPSPGCGNILGEVERNVLLETKITVIDEQFDSSNVFYEIERQYFYQIPVEAETNTPRPLTIYLHGWGGTADSEHTADTVAAQAGHFLLKPQGLAENTGWPGWFIIGGNDRDNCWWGSNVCYPSCDILGSCNICNWTPCTDDTGFISSTIDDMLNTFCVDEDEISMHGFSNGGMKTYEFYWKQPDRFKSLLSLDGGAFPNSFPDLDNSIDYPTFFTIEQESGFNTPGDGWSYEYMPAYEYLLPMAEASGCDSTETPIETPWDGIDDCSCFEFANCESDARVGYCTYRGGHRTFDWMFYLYHWLNYGVDLEGVVPGVPSMMVKILHQKHEVMPIEADAYDTAD